MSIKYKKQLTSDDYYVVWLIKVVFLLLISVLLIASLSVYQESLWIEVPWCYDKHYKEIQKQRTMRCTFSEHCTAEIELKKFWCLIEK